MTQRMGLFGLMREKELKDYYWAYADILRDIGVNETVYDQRIMAFMALKLLMKSFLVKYVKKYYHMRCCTYELNSRKIQV